MQIAFGYPRIVDYKTGGSPKPASDVESLFLRDESRSGYIFQTFVYAAIVNRCLMQKGRSDTKVAPSLLYIHKAAAENYSPIIQIGKGTKAEAVSDFSVYEAEFRERLQSLLEEIFHPDIPFTQTEVESKCRYCDFKALCKR